MLTTPLAMRSSVCAHVAGGAGVGIAALNTRVLEKKTNDRSSAKRGILILN
jgi:hypothetical protein